MLDYTIQLFESEQMPPFLRWEQFARCSWAVNWQNRTEL